MLRKQPVHNMHNESVETKIITPSRIMLTCYLPSSSASGPASWPQFATGTQIAHFQRYRTQCAGRAQQELASGSNGTSTSHGNLNVLGIRRWSGSGSGEKRRTGPAFSPDPRLRAQTFESSAQQHGTHQMCLKKPTRFRTDACSSPLAAQLAVRPFAAHAASGRASDQRSAQLAVLTGAPSGR